MKKINKLVENTVKAFLNEYTDNDFSGAELIRDVMAKKPDSEDMEWIIENFPNAVKSMSTAQANLKASDASPMKKRMGRYAPMFVHVQYHTIEGDAGQTFAVHQTQYYNSNFKDKPGGEKFNPRVTELTFRSLDPEEKMGTILVVTDEYLKDLKKLDGQGRLGKRVSESVNEGVMSDINIIAQEASTIEEFIKEFMADYGDKFAGASQPKLDKWLADLYADAKSMKESSLNENKGQDAATELIAKLRRTLYPKLSDLELDAFKNEMAQHLDATMNEAIDPKYKTFYDQVYKHVNELDRILGANKPPKVPEEIWSKVYGLVGQMADKIDFLDDRLLKNLKENNMNTKTESIVKRLKEDTEYQKFFQATMKMFGVKSPKDLSDKKKKEFFNYVDKNYKAKNEVLNEDMAMFMDAFTIAGGVVMGVLGSIAAYKGLKAARRIGGNIVDNSADALMTYRDKLEDKKAFETKIKPVAERFANDQKLAQMYKELPQYSQSWSKKALAQNKKRTKAMSDIAKYIKSKLSKDEQWYFKEISQLLRTGSTSFTSRGKTNTFK